MRPCLKNQAPLHTPQKKKKKKRRKVYQKGKTGKNKLMLRETHLDDNTQRKARKSL
jgi:hypothetical protein